jgi:hypothetical protein
MSHKALIELIDDHLRLTGLSATRLGREAIGDPRIVFDLRAGRTLRTRTRQRLMTWLEARRTAEGVR